MSTNPAETASFAESLEPPSFNQSLSLHLNDQTLRKTGWDGSYHILDGFRLHGILDTQALELALHDLVCRHAVFRTALIPNPDPVPGVRLAVARTKNDRFTARKPRHMQWITSQATPPLRRRDLSSLDGSVQDSEMKAILQTEHDTPFDCSRPPLLRTLLVRLSHSDHVLVIVLHHLVTDMWSQRILRRDLFALYRAHVANEPDPLPPVRQYSDFVKLEQESFQLPSFQPQADIVGHHWAAFQASELSHEDLAIGPAISADAAGTSHEHLAISDEESRQLRQLARKARTTVFVVLLAALAGAVGLRTRRRHIPVWIKLANRSWSGFQDVCGWFARGRPLAIALPEDGSPRQLLRDTADLVLTALDTQGIPGLLLGTRLDRQAGKKDFDLLFDVLQEEKNPTEVTGPSQPLSMTRLAFGERPKLHSERALEVVGLDEGNRIVLTCAFDSGRFPRQVVTEILQLMAGQALSMAEAYD